jgi:hypothetical protein
MDKQLVQITDLVKDYADIIDEQREKLKKWEACADKLIIFAEIVREVEGNSTRNPEYYNSACAAIELYNRLKNETQSDE